MADEEETAIVPVTIKDLTQGTITGNGVFDQIMSTIDVRLVREYDLNRIKGTDYSKVYLGAMEAAMGQSVAFLLGKDKAANEAALILAQVALAEAQRDKVLAEIVLLELQAPKIEAEIRAIDASILKIEAEIRLIELQQPKIQAETALIGAQQEKVERETTNLKWEHDFVFIHQADEAKHKAHLLALQEETEQAKTRDTVFREADSSSVIVGGLMGSQIDKLDREADLVIVKRATEAAQFLDTVYLPNSPGYHNLPVKGSIGKQKSVWDAQITGFDRDAEKNLAKIFSDSYSVQVSNGEASGAYGVEAPDVQAVMNWAKNQHGVPPL